MDLITTDLSMVSWDNSTIISTMLPTMTDTYDNITNWNMTDSTVLNNTGGGGGGVGSGGRKAEWRPARFKDHPLFAASEIINANYLMVLVAIGAPGNIAAFITVCNMRPFMSSYIYMAVLSIIDTMSLSLQLIYLKIMNKEYIFIPTFACKILMFFTPFSFFFSNWLLVCMTIERLIVIWYPLKVAKFNTIKRAVTFMSIIGFLLAGLCFDKVIVYVAILEPSFTKLSSKCIIQKHMTGYIYYDKHIRPYIDAIVYAILPVTILLICNILIIKTLRKARKARSVMTNTTNKKHLDDQVKQQNQISVMLITVTTVSIITTFPYVTFFIATKDWIWTTTIDDVSLYYFLENVSLILAHSNHAANFFLYFFSGRKFRQHFYKLFCTHFYTKSKSQQSSKSASSLTKNTEATGTTSDNQYACNDDAVSSGGFSGYENSGFSQSKPSLHEIPSINEQEIS